MSQARNKLPKSEIKVPSKPYNDVSFHMSVYGLTWFKVERHCTLTSWLSSCILACGHNNDTEHRITNDVMDMVGFGKSPTFVGRCLRDRFGSYGFSGSCLVVVTKQFSKL